MHGNENAEPVQQMVIPPPLTGLGGLLENHALVGEVPRGPSEVNDLATDSNQIMQPAIVAEPLVAQDSDV